jgi:hypothetical protein
VRGAPEDLSAKILPYGRFVKINHPLKTNPEEIVSGRDSPDCVNFMKMKLLGIFFINLGPEACGFLSTFLSGPRGTQLFLPSEISIKAFFYRART